MLNIPTWLAIVETLGFIGAICMFLYSRFVNVRTVRETVQKLDAQFQQYQKDVGIFFETCKYCRAEVTQHHENIERHLTQDFRDRFTAMADSVEEIKSFLMKVKQ
jgi:hypothetical protein